MSGANNNGREKILANLRRRPAVFPGGALPVAKRDDGESFSSRFFPAAESEGDVVARFIASAKANAATVSRVPAMSDVPAAAAEWLRGREAEMKMVCAPALSELDWRGAGIAAETRAPTGDDEAGATTVVAAAADTGAMLLLSDGGSALTLSLLPPLHLAAVRAADIVSEMDELWARMFRLHPDIPPRAACLVSGPSRTGDIEMELVLGVHGPLAVHVVVADGD